ncbi:MAG: Glucose-1-phosphate adenylyltransferase [Candidatus Woesearchaeota archaeon]|nr:Glucose-1-phosphate adenylyltransferase [Candidatus Woesearchaeota archaeon]
MKLYGLQTSGGMGSRARPLSLMGPTSMIPKGLMRFAGIPLAELQLRQLKNMSITEVFVITQHLENRLPIQSRFGDGSRYGMNISYSDPHKDVFNRGSGDAVLQGILDLRLDGHSVCLPNDNFFEFPGNYLDRHIENNAVMTILTVSRSGKSIIDTYGLVNQDLDHRVIELSEKPESAQEIGDFLSLDNGLNVLDMSFPINTAGYIINNKSLREIAQTDEFRKYHKEADKFDMAGHLIPYLLERDYPVFSKSISKWGDVGTLPNFMETFKDVLSGAFPSVFEILSKLDYTCLEGNIWIHNDSYNRPYHGKTLRQRIKDQDVNIGPNTFIGRDVKIENRVDIGGSDIEKNCLISEGATVSNSYLSPYCAVGQAGYLSNCALGLQVRVHSTKENPSQIDGNSVIGPEIEIPIKTVISNSVIYPGHIIAERSIKNKVSRPSEEEIIEYAQSYM